MMKKRLKIVALSFFCMTASFRVSAQIDPHFSQYYANPLWLNPAMTGIVDGDYRVILNSKQQWGSIDNSYITAAASFDMAPTKNLAFGGIVVDHNAGDISYNYLNALASAAYRIRFGRAGLNMVNFGLQAGVLNKSFDPSKITVGGQFNPNMGYDGSMPVNENFTSTNTLVPDVNAGIMFFDGDGDKRLNPFAGISAAHLTRPVDRFLGNDVRTPIRMTAHGGLRIKTSDALDVTPNALYMKQGNATELAIGCFVQYFVNPETDLLLGGNYRRQDASIISAGMHFKNFIFGMSYDFNTSSLSRATGSKGGFEFSVSYTRRKGLSGPNFFCPRL